VKKFILPALLSGLVFPGLGQMVKGETAKGFAIMIGLPLLLFLAVIFIFLITYLGIILAAGLIILYLWNMYDAYSH
jgi:TM2 domain-containing membrane protein YozV